ncbi:MAG: BatA and WFA domain-containing protein [Phycisphaerae bacterium]|nr:BatA and WFA domain-containing protein [Phycisphaerae bacterium]
MLGFLTFLVPAVLGAAAAVAAPVVIHLLLRSKPRQVVFPAMRFVRKTQLASVSSQRLRQLILLAMRMLVIALVVGLVARAQLPAFSQAPAEELPCDMIVIVDNSGSMNYLQGGVSRLGKGKQLARERIGRLPAGSRAAVMWVSDPAAGGTFLDTSTAVGEVDRIEPTWGGQALGDCLRRAVELAAKADSGRRKEIVLVTDMTGPAWRDVTAVGEIDAWFVVLDPTQGRTNNLSLSEPKLKASAVPAGSSTELAVTLASVGIDGECMVRLDVSGEAVGQWARAVQDGVSSRLSMEVRPAREGVAQGQVSLSQPDNLELDDVRYFTVRVGAAARVLVVRDGVNVGRGDATSRLMTAAIMPAGSGVRGEGITSGPLGRTDLSSFDGVVLANVAGLTLEQWDALDAYVRGGGQLWVVPGDLVSAAAYNIRPAQRLLPATLGEVQSPSGGVRLRAAELDHPLVSPFAGGENPPLSDVVAARRWAIESRAEDAEVALAYADGVPAILRRPVGLGACVLWNLSPAGEFSNLAPLQQFPILVQQTVRLMGADQDARTLYRLGETVYVPLPRQMASPAVGVRGPGQAVETAEALRGDARELAMTADRVGHYVVSFTQDGRRREFGFSVNAPEAESDLAVVAAEQVQDKFPAGRFRVLTPDQANDADDRTVKKNLDLTAPLLLALFALLTGEAFFANRFYKRA